MAETETPPENTPFLKQLVSSDKKARDSALDSLRTYLTSGRSFSNLDLLKLWRGLFFTLWHSDRALTQQRLTATLASLISTLPEPLFIPFITAFWKTMVLNYAGVDSLRMDKFLLLVRRYVNAGFEYLRVRGWEGELVQGYLGVLREVLGEEQGRVSDGLRYHIMDCWVEELRDVDREGEAPVEEIMGVVREVREKGRTKVLRNYAKGVLDDERLRDWTGSREEERMTVDEDEEAEES